MKVVVKVNSAVTTLKSYEVTAGQAGAGQALRIAAEKNVKYELINQDTGFAPENIAAKRVGKDLHIAFEKSDIGRPDLIIENYYEDGVLGAVTGQAENGLYYNYIPESGLQEEAL
ncbi:MAG: Ig domain-containing protein, partial [Pseudomonadota bacterium]